MRKKSILLFCVVPGIVLTSCISSLHGNYVPVTVQNHNPYYEQSELNSNYFVSAEGDTVKYALIPSFQTRPFYDTIRFVGGNKVLAWHRSSGIGSCCASPRFKGVESYTISGDTLLFPYGQYLKRGDTLYPLHRGAIYVKD